MDVQNGVVDCFAGRNEPPLTTPAKAVTAARITRTPVVLVRVAFREETPEISPNNKAFAALRQRGTAMEADVDLSPSSSLGAVHPAPIGLRDQPKSSEHSLK
jgi:hypothetical protein